MKTRALGVRGSRLLAVCGASLLLAGCDESLDTSSSALQCSCVADPVPHCERRDECASSDECPSGTRCLAALGERQRCQVPDQALRPLDTLLIGLGGDRFRLGRQSGESATSAYDWEVLPDARVVTCALFSCLPEVKPGADSVPRIVNYDQCVVARDIIRIDVDEPKSVPFSVAEDVGNVYTPAGDPRCGIGLGSAPRKVTTLAVGCWAYGDSKLLGATRLLYTTPAETGSYGGQIPRDSACLEDFSECYDSERRVFGTCYLGRCRDRCTELSDCVPKASAAMDAGADAAAAGADAHAADAAAEASASSRATTYQCVFRRIGDYVGACLSIEPEGGTP